MGSGFRIQGFKGLRFYGFFPKQRDIKKVGVIRDIPNSCAVFLRMTEDMLWQEMSCSLNSVKGVI